MHISEYPHLRVESTKLFRFEIWFTFCICDWVVSQTERILNHKFDGPVFTAKDCRAEKNRLTICFWCQGKRALLQITWKMPFSPVRQDHEKDCSNKNQARKEEEFVWLLLKPLRFGHN